MKDICLGIDLGTTYSCVAYVNKDGNPVVLKNSEGGLTTPSVVYFEDEKTVIVGEQAKESSKLYPDRSFSLIKESIGEKQGFFIDGKELSADEMSAHILKKVVKDATETLINEGVIKDGNIIKDVVITCPAYFGTTERTATKNAGEIAGLNVLDIINEPTAAAISYGLSSDREKGDVLVYDLGGGTFDITIIRITDDDIRVLATGGDKNLGGKDFDQAIMLYLDSEFEKENNASFMDDLECLSEVYISIEKAKKLLSSKEKTPIMINSTNGRLKCELTREKLESLIEDTINRTIFMVKDTIKEAKNKENDFNKFKVVLVGGSTKIPLIKKKLLEINKDITIFDPDESVAKGAAIFAHKIKNKEKIIDGVKKKGFSEKEIKKKLKNKEIDKLSEETQIPIEDLKFLKGDKKIKNVSSRSFGVIALNSKREEKLFNIILKNDTLPKTKEDFYNISEEGQNRVIITIMESAVTDKVCPTSSGNKIGEVTLDCPDDITMQDKIKVTFTIKENGMLEIEAVAKDKKVDLTIDTKDLISEEEKSEAIKRVEESSIS